MADLKKVNKEIAQAVTGGFQKIEDGVVGGYKKIESTVVGAYKDVEDKFVAVFLPLSSALLHGRPAPLPAALWHPQRFHPHGADNGLMDEKSICRWCSNCRRSHRDFCGCYGNHSFPRERLKT